MSQTVVASAREVLDAAVPALAAAGCESARLDAELLVADSLGIDRSTLAAAPEREVAPPAARLIGERIRRRSAREPVAYILGRKGFRHIELAVDRRVLIPRPETELLVEVALELPEGARVHDVGTGSGAVALALLDERPDLRVSASDASAAALEVARANAMRLGLELELVLDNLPYVREDEWPSLQPEIVRWEPREALVAAAGRTPASDGLDAIRHLVAGAPAGTSMALEHAPDQAAAVRALLDEASTLCDLAGRERVTRGRKRPA